MFRYHIKFVAVFFMLLTIHIALKADNVMTSIGGSVGANELLTVEIEITNDDPFVAFQFDLPIPAGFEYVSGSAVLDPARANGHVLNETMLTGNIIRIFAYSFSNNIFIGNSGSVVSFDIEAGTVPGNYALQLNEAIIGDQNSQNILTNVVNGTATLLAPDIHLNVSTLNFGEVIIGNSMSKTFNISNTGNQTLTVQQINTTDPVFTISGSTNFTISAGGSVNKTVWFNPTVKGTYNEQLTVTSDDPDETTVSITLNAIAYAVNELHTGNMFAFSGDKASLAFSINNMEAFTGFQFDFSLPLPMDYIEGSAVLSGRKTNHQVFANMISGNILRVVAFSADNQTFTGNTGDIVSLEFNITGTGGTYPLNLSNVIIGDAIGDNILSDFYNGQLVVAAPDIHGPSIIDFGEVAINATKSKTVMLYNYGSDTLFVAQFQFTSIAYTSADVLPDTILPGQNSSYTVIVDPLTQGINAATLKIYSNDPDENPFSINLTGNAFMPNYYNVGDAYSGLQDTVKIEVYADNYESFVAFQFDIEYPSIADCILDSVSLTTRAADHVLMVNQIASNKIRVFAYSLSQSEFSGNSGSIITIPLVIDAAGYGTLPLTISEAIMGNSSSQNILYGSSNSILNIIQGFASEVRIFLEGPFNGDKMNTNLNESGYLPLAQPYNDPPWNYNGLESVISLPENTVDWLLLDFRDAQSVQQATPSSIINKKAILLLDDGHTLDHQNERIFVIDQPISNNLYIAAWHRNHLGVISTVPANKNGALYSFDFSYDPNLIYGELKSVKELAPGIFGILSGNGNADNEIDNKDKNDIWYIQNGTSGYLNGDFDMDGEVNEIDKINFWSPNPGNGSHVPE